MKLTHIAAAEMHRNHVFTSIVDYDDLNRSIEHYGLQDGFKKGSNEYNDRV